MRFSVLFVLMFCGALSSLVAQPTSHNLMPTPSSLRWQAGRLPIDREFTVGLKGQASHRLEAGVQRMLRRLEGRMAQELKRAVDTNTTATLLIEYQTTAAALPTLNENESYALEVSARQAVLRAATDIGALRGLETFLQLLASDRAGFYLPAVSVQDQPRFRWRGLMFDSSRHFQPLDIIKRTLDGLAAVKMNVFHWHLTDDQGWRIESKRFPKLHQLASDGQFYTQEQIKEIIAYAAERGIRVMPEIEMPGHATTILVAYPELGSAPGPYKIERDPGVMDPTLDPTREETYRFLDGIIGEVAALFPDEYLHIGGDENEGRHWDKNPQIQAFKQRRGFKTNHDLQAYFTERVARLLEKYKKKTIGWEEILNPKLPKGVVVHSWRGPESLAAAVKQGFDGLLSAGFYIDLSYPASQHYVTEPVAPKANLTAAEEARILGGEATMWSEYVSPETIDSRIWPRTAAIAERLWSPRTVTDVDDMYRRLRVISVQLEELGLTHERNQRVLLRRLAGHQDIAPLETLMSVVEPLKQYNRGKQRWTTMLAPLTAFVDAARPDSETARVFNAQVEALLADAPRFQTNRASLQHLLTRWRDARPAIEAILAQSAALRDTEILAQELAELSAAGLEAMTALTEGKAPTEQWRAEKMAVLERAAKPKPAAVEFAILPGMKQLVIAAAEWPQLQTTSPAEWRQRIKAIAETAAGRK